MPKINLTTGFVQNPPLPDGPKVEYFDTHVPGFMLEVRCNGKATYYQRFRDKAGRKKQFRIGPSDSLSLDEARSKARQIRSQNIMGINPGVELDEFKRSPLFKTFTREQYLPFVKIHKKTWSEDQRVLERRLIPLWGHKKMIEFCREDFVHFQSMMISKGAKPGTVNRTMALVKYIFNLAVRWEILMVSPVAKIRKLADNTVIERYLSEEETLRLFEELRKCKSKVMADLIEFLILTGARRGEAVHALWEDMDFENKIWKIPLSKSGKTRYIPLSEAALDVLYRRKTNNDDNIYVFPSPKTGKPYIWIHGTWDRIRIKAGLPDVRMHDLRHNFASILINSGRTLYEVQKLLGHNDSSTTERYAHLAKDTLSEAANLVGRKINKYVKNKTNK